MPSFSTAPRIGLRLLLTTDDGQTRLLWRMRNATYDWTSPSVVAQLATDLGDFVFVRNILLGIKERAEGRPIESLAATTPQVALYVLVFGGFLGSLAGLVVSRDWLRPLAAIAVTGAVTLLLVFAMPPLWVDVLSDVGVYVVLWWLHRGRHGADAARRGPTTRSVPSVSGPGLPASGVPDTGAGA